MVTQRKSPARPKPGGGHKKAGPARPARPAAKPAHALKPKVRPGAAKPVAAKAVVKPAAKMAMKPAAKGVVKPAAKPVGKPRLAVAKRTVDPTVRPLGVLPPSAQARSLNRAPVAAAAVRPRPMPARAGVEAPRG